MPPSTTAVDVVIATRHRPDSLDRLLQDLEHQILAPRSVTVVDDSSRPVDWRARHPSLAIAVVRPDHRLLISAAKNRGAADGDGELIAFIDDDNTLPPSLLSALAADLEGAPRRGAVMPGVVYHRRPNLVWVYATPFGASRWTFEYVGRNRPRDPALEGRILPTDALPNLAMVRRSAFHEIDGFEERLPVNSSADLCQRLKRSGWEVVADSGILTQHDVDPPGVPGYWAEHTVVDPVRARREVADWFLFQRRWNSARGAFAARASLHALGFVLPQLVGLAVRPTSGRLPLIAAMVGGYRDGLGTRLPELPARSAARPGGLPR
jgi:glycosyltransferase involved in cell wall biosynthesis